MMKKFLLLAAIIAGIQVHAQLSMTVEVPPTGVLLKSQLWNTLIVNNAVSTKLVKLRLTLSDGITHEPVLTAVTMPFSVSPGAKQLKASDIAVIYDYESAFMADKNPDGFLGAGNYEACYILDDITNTHEPGALENCINFTVEPLMPPMLTLPADQSILQSLTQLAWLPPSPPNIFNNLSYDLIVVEVQQGQTSAEAVQQNIPVINSNNQDLFFSPSLNPSLDTGKLYAWQVIAKNNNRYAAQSEVWTFRLNAPEKDSALSKPNDFIVVRNMQEVSGIHTLADRTLRVKYYSFDAAHKAKIFLYDAQRNLIKQFNQNIAYGDNFLVLALDNSFKSKTIYSIQIDLGNNQKSTASFILK